MFSLRNNFHAFSASVIAILYLQGSSGQEACTTTSETQGSCIIVMQCNPFFNVFKQSASLPASATADLKKSYSGVERNIPKVCCPNDNTPQGPKASKSGVGSVPNPPDVTHHQNVGLINAEFCGPPIRQKKIIGGHETRVLEFPWMALIKYDVQKKTQDFRCGGTIINKRYILTAAHCVTGLKEGYELHSVRLGDHNLDKEEDCDAENGVKIICAPKYQDFLIQSHHVHNGHNSEFKDDIALIRLDRDADFSAINVKPICLPVGSAATIHFSKAIVTGWGITESGYTSQELLKVRLKIAERNGCARVWRQSNGIEVTHKHICAGGQSGLNFCAGDSGGPLQYVVKIVDSPKYFQYGIASFGTKKCGVMGYPGVYTSVPYYMDWILDTIY